jgi:hypothetical protein
MRGYSASFILGKSEQYPEPARDSANGNHDACNARAAPPGDFTPASGVAYTNRFLTLVQVVRQLHPGQSTPVTELAQRQSWGLKRLIGLIKLMQGFGVTSLLLCTFSMLMLFIDLQTAGKALFGLSLLAQAVSLVISLWEVLVSAGALIIVSVNMDNRLPS